MENTRYTIDLAPAARTRLAELAKQYKLTQGEVIEVLVLSVRDMEPETLVDNLLRARRTEKEAERRQARELRERLRKLLPEERAALLERVA
jgi:hypothetical protein